MIRNALIAICVIVWLFEVTHAQAQSDFFQGKTIRIIVGYSPGGGYDALARMLSRQMPKYIPGHPTILVENMAGAGSLLAANHIFKVAKPDGLTIGRIGGALHGPNQHRGTTESSAGRPDVRTCEPPPTLSPLCGGTVGSGALGGT